MRIAQTDDRHGGAAIGGTVVVAIFRVIVVFKLLGGGRVLFRRGRDFAAEARTQDHAILAAQDVQDRVGPDVVVRRQMRIGDAVAARYLVGRPGPLTKDDWAENIRPRPSPFGSVA